MAEGLIPQLAALTAGPAPEGLGLLEHLRDGGAWKNVVELLKEQGVPVGFPHRLPEPGGMGIADRYEGKGCLRFP